MNENNYRITNASLCGNITVTEILTDSADPNSNERFSNHEEFEIYHFIDGTLSFFCENEMFMISSGDIVVLSPRMIHKRVIDENIRYHRKHFKISTDFFSDKKELYKRLTERGFIKIDSCAVHELCLDNLLLEVENGIDEESQYGNLCASSSLFYFFVKAEKYCNEYKTPAAPVIDESIKEIIRYINGNLSRDLSYTLLSEKFFISPKSLYRKFKNETGLSLSKYIKSRRIIKAKDILTQGGTANEAAEAVGYTDYSVFYRSFISETGISPCEFAHKKSLYIK